MSWTSRILATKEPVISGVRAVAALCGTAESSRDRMQIDSKTHELTVHAAAMSGEARQSEAWRAYSLLAADLRDLQRVRETLELVDTTLPTLVVSECV